MSTRKSLFSKSRNELLQEANIETKNSKDIFIGLMMKRLPKDPQEAQLEEGEHAISEYREQGGGPSEVGQESLVAAGGERPGAPGAVGTWGFKTTARRHHVPPAAGVAELRRTGQAAAGALSLEAVPDRRQFPIVA